MEHSPHNREKKKKPHFMLWLKSQTLLVCVVAGTCVSLLVHVAMPEQFTFPLKMILAMMEAMILGSMLGMFLRMVSGMLEGAIAGMAVSMTFMAIESLGLSSLFWYAIIGGITGTIYSVPLWYFNRYVKMKKTP